MNAPRDWTLLCLSSGLSGHFSVTGGLAVVAFTTYFLVPVYLGTQVPKYNTNNSLRKWCTFRFLDRHWDGVGKNLAFAEAVALFCSQKIVILVHERIECANNTQLGTIGPELCEVRFTECKKYGAPENPILRTRCPV